MVGEFIVGEREKERDRVKELGQRFRRKAADESEVPRSAKTIYE